MTKTYGVRVVSISHVFSVPLCIQKKKKTGFKTFIIVFYKYIYRTVDENKSIFLRVDIVLHGATFFIVFSDADHMPPPYRVDNFSEVSGPIF